VSGRPRIICLVLGTYQAANASFTARNVHRNNKSVRCSVQKRRALRGILKRVHENWPRGAQTRHRGVVEAHQPQGTPREPQGTPWKARCVCAAGTAAARRRHGPRHSLHTSSPSGRPPRAPRLGPVVLQTPSVRLTSPNRAPPSLIRHVPYRNRLTPAGAQV
jgi:hypothetical protein